MKWFLVLLMTLIGGLLPAQAGFNAELGRHAGHPVLAAVVNFAVGWLALVLLTLVLRVPWPSAASLAAAPWWAWVGGLIGASLVFLAAFSAPELGATLLVACLVFGQLVASVLIDHFGLAGYPERAVTATRIAGVSLLGVGTVLVLRG